MFELWIWLSRFCEFLTKKSVDMFPFKTCSNALKVVLTLLLARGYVENNIFWAVSKDRSIARLFSFTFNGSISFFLYSHVL